MTIYYDGKIIAGADPNTPTVIPDGSTISKSGDIISTIGVKSKNNQILYDWIGTKAEYDSGIIDGSISEDWICWIADDVPEEGISYNILTDKPQINNVELSGNKTLNDLGIQPKGDYSTVSQLSEKADVTYVNAQLDTKQPKGEYSDINLGNLSEAGKKVIKDNSGGGLEIGDIGLTTYVDETKGLRRILNGQIVTINEHTQKFLDRLKIIKTNNPTLFVDEQTWQSEVLLNVDGTCDKFVIDEVNETIRIPKYPDYIEVLPNKLGVQGNGNVLGLNNGTYNDLSMSGFQGTWSSVVSTNSLITRQAGEPAGATAVQGHYMPNNLVGVTTDPTKSGIEANTNVTKLKLYYFIQINTGQETKSDISNETQLNNPFTFGMYQFSDCELNNLSWLRSQGQWNNKTIYPDFYTWLLQIQSGQLVVNGVSVKLANKQISTFAVPDKDAGGDISPVLPPDGELTEGYTDFDYVLNTSDETFRLPIKVKGASGKAVVGNGMTMGLNTKQGNAGLVASAGSGAYIVASPHSYGKPANGFQGGDDLKNTNISITTDPTKSGIETSADEMYLYFYVGETVQNANLVNIGRLEEKLSGMVDCDVVIEFKVNTDGSWYKKWSNGFLEQGGFFNGGASGWQTVTFTYVKPFKDTTYQLMCLGNWSEPSSSSCRILSRTTTTAEVRVANNTVSGQNNVWYACGRGV